MGILAKLKERDPMRNVEGAFNEAELRRNATRSALEKVNEAIRVRKIRREQDRQAGNTSNE